MARRSQTKTNNSTSQGKHKQQRHPNLQQFPLLKLAHTTVRQADRQTDRQIKTKRQLWQNITKEAVRTYLKMFETWIPKKTRKS